MYQMPRHEAANYAAYQYYHYYCQQQQQQQQQQQHQTDTTTESMRLPHQLTPPQHHQRDIQKSRTKKRVRTVFTPEQLKRLEQEFENQMYLVGDDRVHLAQSLNLSEAQVKVWFQNRRIKHRKQQQLPGSTTITD